MFSTVVRHVRNLFPSMAEYLSVTVRNFIPSTADSFSVNCGLFFRQLRTPVPRMIVDARKIYFHNTKLTPHTGNPGKKHSNEH